MTTVIRLDGAALDRLFPEGSEARLEIQRAATVQMLERLVQKDSERLLKDLGASISSQVKQVVGVKASELGLTGDWYRGYSLNSEQTKEIRRQAEAQFQQVVHQEFYRQKEELQKNIDGMLAKWGEKYIQDKLTAMAKQALANLTK